MSSGERKDPDAPLIIGGSVLSEADKRAFEALERAGQWSKMGMEAEDTEEEEKPTLTNRVLTTLYGKIPPEELKRVAALSTTLFFIIGGYWLLRSLKDTVLITINGLEYIPKAKMASLFVVLSLVFVYNKLIDIFPKHQLFYILGSFYAATFSLIALLLSHPTIGLANTDASPYRPLGWVSYFMIESFGSIGVSLYWAFVNSSIDLEGAKSAYGLIIAGAQVGSVLGPTLATQAPVLGVPTLYFCGGLCMVLMMVCVFLYTNKYGKSPCPRQEAAAAAAAEAGLASEGGGKKKKKKGKAGMMEGLILMKHYPYIMGLAAISCLFMVEVTILDYQMKYLAKARYSSSEDMAAFMGTFGQVTNGVSFLFSLLGTSFVVRRYGLRTTLLAFPSLCVGAIVTFYMSPTLWTVFGVMVFLKALSYALNNPCKEMLYQPTSSAIKYKSKSWIDIFGARGSKAAGSVVTNAFNGSAEGLVAYGSAVSLVVGVTLVAIAWAMGREFEALTEAGLVLGEDDDEATAAAATRGAKKDTEGGGG